MKKLYALLLTIVMFAALTISAFAATSPQALVQDSVASISIDVAEVAVTAASAQLVQDAFELTANETHMANLGVPADAYVAAVINVSYSGEIPAGGVKIPITVSNADAGDYVIILHRSSVEPYEWEVVGRGVLDANKTIIGTFHSFSPVVVMVVDGADYSATGIKAPKTGQ